MLRPWVFFRLWSPQKSVLNVHLQHTRVCLHDKDVLSYWSKVCSERWVLIHLLWKRRAGDLLSLPARSLHSVAPNLVGPTRWFVEDNFPVDRGWGKGFGMVPVRYVYSELRFYCYYIVIYDEIITQLACYSLIGFWYESASNWSVAVTAQPDLSVKDRGYLQLLCWVSSLAQPLLRPWGIRLSLPRSTPPGPSRALACMRVWCRCWAEKRQSSGSCAGDGSRRKNRWGLTRPLPPPPAVWLGSNRPRTVPALGLAARDPWLRWSAVYRNLKL